MNKIESSLIETPIHNRHKVDIEKIDSESILKNQNESENVARSLLNDLEEEATTNQNNTTNKNSPVTVEIEELKKNESYNDEIYEDEDLNLEENQIYIQTLKRYFGYSSFRK